MSIYAPRYRSDETLSALGAVLSGIGENHQDDLFITALTPYLSKGAEELRASIAYHDRKSLAADSEAVDGEFNESFVKLRDYVELMATVPQFGARAESSEKITDIIRRHDRNLHNKPKDEQIALFDSVLAEVGEELQDLSLIHI